MGTQNTASPLSSDPAGLENVIAELRDDLELQRTIYRSLADLPQDDDTTEQLNVCRAEFKRIQKQLSEARRAHDHGTYHISPTFHPH
jgi:cell division FtsZ-interacting protein ZapD